MAFKKLDSDAVSSTTGRALDAFVLRGEDANYRAAHEARGRSVGTAYPLRITGASGVDHPVIASPWRSALPLSAFPISSQCTEIRAQVRGLATHVTAAGAVKFALAAQLIDGTMIGPGDFLTVSGSATVQTVEFTLDVQAIQGQLVVLWLVFESFPQTSTAASGTQAGSDISLAGTRLDIDNVSFTFDAGKRYQLTFDEDGAGAAPRQAFGYCGTRMIQSVFSGDVYNIIPAMPESMETYSAFDVSLLELGRFEVYGWTVEESAVEALPDLATDMRPGGRLRARTCQELYRRGHSLHSRRTRLYCVGLAESDRGFGNQRWIRKQELRTSGAFTAFIGLAGDLPTYQIQADSAVPSTEYRRRYRIHIVYATSAREYLNVGVRSTVEINTFGSGAWTTDTVTPTLDQTVQITPPTVYDIRGQITALSLSDGTRDSAYYAWSFDDLLAGESGLRMLSATFEEAAAQKAVAARLVEIALIVSRGDDAAPTDPPGPVMVTCVSALIMVDEGF